MKPGPYTMIITGPSNGGEFMVQKVWYLSKGTYEHFMKMLPEPQVEGMVPTENLERHGYEVMETMGLVVLPQTFQDGGDQPTEQAASE